MQQGYAVTGWANFFVAVAAPPAALAGLPFVAASITLAKCARLCA